jgi:hypothetical protein
MSTTATHQIDLSTLSDADLDRVSGGIRQINPLGAQIGIMLINGVLDPMWEIVGKTGHLPTPEEHL